jgi:hypothetical protein
MKLAIVSLLANVLSLLIGAIAIQDPQTRLEAVLSRATTDALARLRKDEIALRKRGIEASCTVKNIAIRKELCVIFSETTYSFKLG